MRTFPDAPLFAEGGDGQRALFNCLKAYSNYDDDMGYCQGFSFVCGVLLFEVDE